MHFPLADTYVQGGASLEEPGEKEDDPNGTPDAEPAELTAMGAQDAADAEAVLNQLMRTGANVAPPTGGEEGSSAEFLRRSVSCWQISTSPSRRSERIASSASTSSGSSSPISSGARMWMRSSTSTWMMMTVTTPLPACHTHT